MIETSNKFKADTLRRRMHFLSDKLEGPDSTNAKRFNKMEVEALEAAIGALNNEGKYTEVSSMFVSLLTSIETGTTDELARIVEESHALIDKHGL